MQASLSVPAKLQASQAWAELEYWENSESLLSFASRLATAVCAGALQHTDASMMPAATAERHCCLLFEVHAKRFCTAWNLNNQVGLNLSE